MAQDKLFDIASSVNSRMAEITFKTGSFPVKSRAAFDIRKKSLNEVNAIVEEALKEFPGMSVLLDLRFRIQRSIAIMDIAESFGVITEP